MTSARIDWKQVEQKGQTVILDFRNVLHERQNALPCSGYSYRSLNFSNSVAGVQRHSLSSLIEFAALTQQVTAGVNPLAVLLDEFINQYMRNNNIWLTLAHQSIYQLDDHLGRRSCYCPILRAAICEALMGLSKQLRYCWEMPRLENLDLHIAVYPVEQQGITQHPIPSKRCAMKGRELNRSGDNWPNSPRRLYVQTSRFDLGNPGSNVNRT